MRLGAFCSKKNYYICENNALHRDKMVLHAVFCNMLIASKKEKLKNRALPSSGGVS